MEMFERLLGILTPIFVVVFVGFLYAKKRSPNLDTANKANIEIFTPLLIFSVLSQRQFELIDYLPLALLAAFIVILPGLLSIPMSRYLDVHWKSLLPPMMFRNSGNLGLPLFVLAFGEAALAPAIILFIVENTLHFSLGMRMMRSKASLLALLRIPILQATVIGLLFALFNWQLPEPVALGVELLGQVSIPLMLFSLGVRMAQTHYGYWRIGLLAGIWAPIVGVVSAYVLILVFSQFISLSQPHIAMLYVFAALPPAVLNFLIAEQFKQEPEKVASVVLIGNVCSLVSMPLVLAFVLS